jgi:hypothetical protein
LIGDVNSGVTHPQARSIKFFVNNFSTGLCANTSKTNIAVTLKTANINVKNLQFKLECKGQCMHKKLRRPIKFSGFEVSVCVALNTTHLMPITNSRIQSLVHVNRSLYVFSVAAPIFYDCMGPLCAVGGRSFVHAST